MEPDERPHPRPVDPSIEPVEHFALAALATGLRQGEQYRRTGKAGSTLVRDDQLSIVLEVVRAGSAIREHRSPATATVVLLEGRASFVYEDGARRTPLARGELVAFSAEVDHALEADEDSLCLIVIGGRTRGA